MQGIKYDQEKTRWSLLPMDVMDTVVRVLMHGSRKYEDNNWMKVIPKERYYDACVRHISAWQQGEKMDQESGLPHLAHAICCLIFLLWHDNNEDNNGHKT